MWLINPFRSRSSNLLLLLARQAYKTCEGMENLRVYFRTVDPAIARHLQHLEKEGDELRRILIDELERSSATPVDRRDLFALSRAIDDVLDYGYTTVDEIVMFEVEPTELMGKMVDILREAVGELHLAILQLGTRPQLALAHATQAKQHEKQVGRIYREAIVELFQKPQTVEDVKQMLKKREIYRHLFISADRGDEAANILSNIVIKMA